MSVYFILCDSIPEPIVKIGKTTNIKQRVQSISTSTPFDVRLIALCEDIEEKELHNKFNHLRYKNEWFRFTEEIRGFIIPYEIKIEKKIKEKKQNKLLPTKTTKKPIIDWNSALSGILEGFSIIKDCYSEIKLDLDNLPLLDKGFISQGLFDFIETDKMNRQLCEFAIKILKQNDKEFFGIKPYPLYEGSYLDNFGSAMHSSGKSNQNQILIHFAYPKGLHLEIYNYTYFTEKMKFLWTYKLDILEKYLYHEDKEFSKQCESLGIDEGDLQEHIYGRRLKMSDLYNYGILFDKK